MGNPTRHDGARPSAVIAEGVLRIRSELVALEAQSSRLDRDRRIELGRQLVRLRAELDGLAQVLRGWADQ